MERDNLVHLPVPPEPTPEQREYWLGQAGYWGVREEDAINALEYAQRQRQAALQMLGLVAVKRETPDGTA